MRYFHGFWTVLAMACWGNPAHAATRVLSVVYGTGPGADKAAVHVGHYLREITAEDNRFTVVRPEQMFESDGGKEAKDSLEQASALIARGRTAYESLDLDEAVSLLSRAVSRLQRTVSYANNYRVFADALSMLAAAHLLRGEEPAAIQRIQEALMLVPDLEPDPHIFNTTMRTTFSKAVESMRTVARGKLVAASNPGYAAIYVDGTFRGVTPDTIPDLPQGVHYVRMVKDGYTPWGKVIGVVADAEASQTAVISRIGGANEYLDLVNQAGEQVRQQNKKSNQVPSSVDQLGVVANADMILLGLVRLDGEQVVVQLHVYDLLKNKRAQVTEQIFSYGSATSTYRSEIKDLLRRTLRSEQESINLGPGDRNVSNNASNENTNRDSFSVSGAPPAFLIGASGICEGFLCSSKKRIAFGIAMAGLATFAGAATSWGLASSEQSKFQDFNLTQFQATAHRDNAKTYALIGDVLGGVGGAALVAAITLWFLDKPAKADKEDAPNNSPSSKKDDTTSQFRLLPAPLIGGAMMNAQVRF